MTSRDALTGQRHAGSLPAAGCRADANAYTDYRVAKLFKTKKNDYRIEKIQEYGYTKFNSTRFTWKVYGDVDIFHVHAVIEELIYRMENKYKMEIQTV